ncbi:MAG: CBS domain-containing protein [Bdellovibrionota bacterium]
MITRAKDIMSTELIIGHPEMTIEEAIKVLVNNKITGIPVVDADQRLVGVVSEYDIIKIVEKEEGDRPLDLNRVIKFSQKVTTISENTKLSDILKHFVERKVRRLPVVNEENKLVGIITRRDIMRILFYRSKPL